MLRALQLTTLLAAAAAVAVSACEIAANIDRTKIPGGGGGTAQGGAATGGGGAQACEPTLCHGTDSDCRKRACDSAGCTFADAPSGTSCTDDANPDAILCDGFGNCVACLAGGDCPPALPVCVDNVCHVPTCRDAEKNSDETDVDCGGSCPPCENGEACLVSTDCTSKFCQGAGGGPGSCAACVNPGDCDQSLSCVNGVCQ